MEKPTRVKYEKLQDGTYRSSNYIGYNLDLYYILIIPNNKEVILKVDDEVRLVQTCTTKRLTQLQSIAKKILIEAGVNFYDEIRAKANA